MQPVAAGETRTGRMDAPAVLDGPFFCSLYWPGLRRSRRTPPGDVMPRRPVLRGGPPR